MSTDPHPSTPTSGEPSCADPSQDLAWDLMTRRFEADVQDATISQWIQEDLEMMEVELADFASPLTSQRRR